MINWGVKCLNISGECNYPVTATIAYPPNLIVITLVLAILIYVIYKDNIRTSTIRRTRSRQ